MESTRYSSSMKMKKMLLRNTELARPARSKKTAELAHRELNRTAMEHYQPTTRAVRETNRQTRHKSIENRDCS